MSDPKPNSDRLHITQSRLFWPVLGLVLLIAFNTIYDPRFLRLTVQDGHLYGLTIDILNQGSRGLLLALGMTLVIATGGVDLSVGSVMAMCGGMAALLMTKSSLPLPAVLAASIGVGALAGLVNGALIAGAGVQSIGYLAGLPFAAILAVILYVAAHLFLRRTAVGLFIEAVGDNETASRFAGLASRRIKCLAYVFSGACAACAGLLATANIHTADPYRTGQYMELDAIFAVVVGGTALSGGRFTLAGSFIGALLLQTLTVTMYNLGVAPAIAPVPKALVIVAVCLLQSETFRIKIGRVLRRKPA